MRSHHVYGCPGNALQDIRPVVECSDIGRTLQQGYLESSNVKMINELVSMIMVSRLYEANMKLVTTKNEASSGLMSLAMG